MEKKTIRIASSEEGSASQLYGDENLKTHYLKNVGTSKITLVSCLHEFYPKHIFPNLYPHPSNPINWEKIELKPSYTAYLPHKYWRIFTRDNTPAKVKWLQDIETQGENFA